VRRVSEKEPFFGLGGYSYFGLRTLSSSFVHSLHPAAFFLLLLLHSET
jgi:hypothetical protein